MPEKVSDGMNQIYTRIQSIFRTPNHWKFGIPGDPGIPGMCEDNSGGSGCGLPAELSIVAGL